MDTDRLPSSSNRPAARPPPIVLVVDDREANLEAMRAILDGDDSWQLRCVDSGEAALRCLLQEDVSLVLLDVQMPGMDGYEVAKLMRGNPNTRYTPIIFVSAIVHTQESILRGYNTGAVDFILKPFDPVLLRQKIHNLLAYENNRRELQQLTRELERERAFNDSILSNAAEGIMVVGEDGRIQYANPAMAEMTGCSVTGLNGKAFLELIDIPVEEGGSEPWQNSPVYLHWRSHQTWRSHDARLHTARADAQRLPVTLSCAPLPRLQRAMVVMVRDTSTERELLTRMESLIITDPLTGLLNRRGFYQAMEAALARNKRTAHPLAVIYLDLDGFKHINDSLGHAAGDELLKHVGAQLKSGLRIYDSLARLGGDEFTVLLDSLEHTRDAARVADKLLALISERYMLGDKDIRISASIGIACYPECGDSVEELLRAADMAMYDAKKNGRNGYRFYSPQMTARAHARLGLEQRLRQAIEQQHFALYYQPQYEISSGRLRGFEALLRWSQGNPDKATPDIFIPLLEETRLINPLGHWIFREGMTRLAELSQHFGVEQTLSINVSPVQFSQPHLVDDIAKILHEYGLDASQLEVEVTETVLLQNLDATHEHLHQLRDLGAKIAVDDFGTGYSSLAYLRQFELDTLKIDRMFISNMLGSPRDAAVVKTIIDLGRHLDMDIIAEGVETQAQREWLLEHECGIMQGWLVSPALTFDAAMQVPERVDWSRVPLGRA